MKLVTVATHSERYYPYLKLSAEKHRHELITLGWGQTWKGYMWKFELMREYLRTLPEDEIVCFVDAFDVIVLDDPYTIEQKFMEICNHDPRKILISVEQDSEHVLEKVSIQIAKLIEFSTCNHTYINSGTYIGVSSTLSVLFENLCKEFTCKPTSNDQGLLQEYCIRHSDTFIMDTECDLFLTITFGLMAPVKEGSYHIEYVDGKLKYKNTFPCFLHGNGFTNMDAIIKKEGYDPTLFTAEKVTFMMYWNRIVEYFIFGLKRYWIYIVIFVVICWVFKCRYFS